MKIHYPKIIFLSAIILLYINPGFADEVPPPPPMSATDKKATKNNTRKKSKAIKSRIQTPAKNKDKPDEQQQQFPAPELVIRYKEGTRIEEYRVNGQLRYAKITPKLGPAYYLIDTNGDGTFDKRHDQLENPPIQQWLLYSW